jgi:hypothetical protein
VLHDGLQLAGAERQEAGQRLELAVEIPSATIARDVVSASQGVLVLQPPLWRFTQSAVLLSIE